LSSLPYDALRVMVYLPEEAVELAPLCRFPVISLLR
jgi:hypothetical protein